MPSRAASSTQSPPIPAGLTRAQLLEIYRYLRLTRTLDERLTALYRQSKVIGGLFRYLGRHVPRGPQLRRRAEGPARRDRGIQPLGLLDASREAVRGQGPGGEGEGLRYPRRHRGRERRARGIRSDQARGRAGPARSWGAVRRGQDVPPQGSRRA